MRIGLTTASSWAPVPRMMLLFMAVQLVIMLPFSLLEPSAMEGTSLALFTQSCLCMGLHCVWEMERLRVSNQRLHSMRAPSAAWHGSVAGCLQSVTLVWLVFSAGLMLRFATPASGMHWITGGAVLSLICCLGAIACLHRSGITQRGRPLAATLAAYAAGAVLLAFFAAQFIQGPSALMAWLDRLPSTMQWAMLLSWPAAALLLRRQWQVQPPAGATPDLAQEGAARPPRTGWRERLASQLRRYSLLSQRQDQTLARPFAPALRASYLLLVPLTALLYLRASWGTAFPQSEHLLPMVMVMMFCAHNLVVRDLHWRHQLVPGGLHTRSIALNIYFSSLAVYLALTVLLGLCVLVVLCLAGRMTAGEALNQLLLRTLIVPELAFSLACAVAFKGLGRWTVEGACVAGIILSLPVLRGVMQYPARAYIEGNAAYCAVLLLLTPVMLLLARRTWTLQKLSPYLQGR